MSASWKLLVSILCIVYSSVVFSAEIESFPSGAEKLLPTVPTSFKTYTPYAINYSPEWLGSNFLFLAPELSGHANVFKSSPEQDGFSVKFQLDRTEFVVSFDGGASEDPGFLVESLKLRESAVLGGETLYISSSGHFYSVARSNEDFEVKRKYVVRNGELEEVRQPFYSVNMDCTASEDIILFQLECDGGEEVARIPKDGTVRVLARSTKNGCQREGRQYLVLTSFGLLGWVTSTAGYLHFSEGKPLSCLNYHGD